MTQPTGADDRLLGEVATAAVSVAASVPEALGVTAEALGVTVDAAVVVRAEPASPDRGATGSGAGTAGVVLVTATAAADSNRVRAGGALTAAAVAWVAPAVWVREAAARDAGVTVARAVGFDVRAEEALVRCGPAADLAELADVPLADDPEFPESDESAHAAPAAARIAAPTPSDTARPPRRPT
ncbi:hypothetical protein ACXDF8_04680 [Mycolicibacterium sp. CBM1]